jgi:hypothetical protein
MNSFITLAAEDVSPLTDKNFPHLGKPKEVYQAFKNNEDPNVQYTPRNNSSSYKYPEIYYRDKRYGEIFCMLESDIKNDHIREVYTFDLDQVVGTRFTKKTIHRVRVAEFFSGKRYFTQAQRIESRKFLVKMDGKRVVVDCHFGKKNVLFLESGGIINEAGDYLKQEIISAEAGIWGDVSLEDYQCDVGKERLVNCALGPGDLSRNHPEAMQCEMAGGIWGDCDIAINGLTLRNKDGKIIWARLIAAAVPYDTKTKHWTGLFKVRDSLHGGAILLDDGTFIMDFDNYVDRMPIVRVDLKTGRTVGRYKDIAVVSLDNWVAFKKATYDRAFGKDSPCVLGKKMKLDEKECPNVNLYLDTLKGYLFPDYVAPKK